MTGHDYIQYILQNNLENEPIYDGEKILGFETLDEAAVRLSVGVATVRAWIKLDQIEGYMIGNQWFVFAGSKPKNNSMLNYNSRTIEPIVSAITDEMTRKFLTKTARSQSQTIMFFRDPLRLVPVNNIAEIADKLTRNEILTSNEIRGVIGFKPSDDPKADKLINSNLNQPDGEQTDQTIENEPGESIPDTSIGDMPISMLSENDN